MLSDNVPKLRLKYLSIDYLLGWLRLGLQLPTWFVIMIILLLQAICTAFPSFQTPHFERPTGDIRGKL